MLSKSYLNLPSTFGSNAWGVPEQRIKIRQQEAIAWWNCRQEPDGDDDGVMEDGEETQDELGDDWRKFFDFSPDDAPSAGSPQPRAQFHQSSLSY